MASEAQKRRGIPLPYPVTGYPTVCVQFQCPDSFEYRAAVRGQLYALGQWFTWEKTGTPAATDAAAYWRQLLEDSLVFKESDACCDETDDDDILEDSLAELADGVLSNTLIGGAVRAIGYAIDDLGRIITETVLPVIGITLLGLAVASVASIIIGGVTVGTVAVAAGETVEVLVATGAAEGAAKIIELVALAAAA